MPDLENMLSLSYCFALLFGGVILYQQTDYILTLERAEVVSYDTKYVGSAKISNSKCNRTHVGVTIIVNFKLNFGNDLKVQVEGYKFTSNEYRPFPIQFSRNICAMFASNDFGVQNIYLHGNFTGCPVRKGTFHIVNWGPDYSKFPPYIPGGRYMLDLKVIYLQNEILDIQGFAAVKPIKEIFP